MALSNAQYDELIRQYNAKQIRNQHIMEDRKNEAYARSARLKEIDDTISSCSVAQAKKLLLGEDSSALTELKHQIAALHEEKSVILSGLGYPEDYFTPPYDCPDCKDTGYIGNERCHCFKQAAIDLIYTQSNIRSILSKENFDHFSYEYFSDTEIEPKSGASSLALMKHARETSEHFIQTFGSCDPAGNLFFYGNTGVGKTFLSNCIAKELLDRGFSVIYFTAFQLFDIFAKNVFDKDTDASAAHQNIFDCDLLIVDDLGTEMSNSFTTSQFFLCLNERLLRRKSTIISTNLTIDQLADIYSERTLSRVISNYTMLKLYGNDIRIQKKLH